MFWGISGDPGHLDELRSIGTSQRARKSGGFSGESVTRLSVGVQLFLRHSHHTTLLKSPYKMPRSEAHQARNESFRAAFAKPFEYKESAQPTAQVIQEGAQKLQLENFVEEVPKGQGARIHWLGQRTAKNVLLYFHGECFEKKCLK